jgi:hypothetical protein
MSPRSRGRPPGRGRKKARRPAAHGSKPHLTVVPTDDDLDIPMFEAETTDCWFDEPDPGDRRSWAVPAAHGTYDGLDLELLNPDDEDQRGILMQARHAEFAEAFHSDEDVLVDGQPVNPRLHVAMHQIVANQLLADDPPQTWQTVQRLAGLGYDWHNIMHMIASVVTDDVYRALKEGQRHDPVGYARRLTELPGDWPPPEPAT